MYPVVQFEGLTSNSSQTSAEFDKHFDGWTTELGILLTEVLLVILLPPVGILAIQDLLTRDSQWMPAFYHVNIKEEFLKPTLRNSVDDVSTASHWELLGNRNDVAARVASKISKLQTSKPASSEHKIVLYDCVSRDCVAETTKLQLLEIYQTTTEGYTEVDFDIETQDYLKNGPTGKEVRHALFTDSQCQGLPTCQAALVIAHAYLADSYVADEKKDDELAWSRIAEARYWAGVAAIAEQGAKIARDAAIQTGAAGGVTTTKLHNLEVMEEAFRFVRGMPINLSIRKRTEATRDWIIDFAIEANKSRVDNKLRVITAGIGGAKTVRKWFRTMPDAVDLKLN